MSEQHEPNEDRKVEVWHYSSRGGKVELVQHFTTEWNDDDNSVENQGKKAS